MVQIIDHNKYSRILADNIAEVTGSPIVAKAIMEDGQGVRIIVVYAKSTRAQFYWEYSAKTARSPRKKWKKVTTYAVALQIGPIPEYDNIDAFIQHLSKLGRVCRSLKIVKRKLFDKVAARQEHDRIEYDWHRPPVVRQPRRGISQGRPLGDWPNRRIR